jgi:catechol 2,3-dioxygenase-like lactoylglutathione lyase family enzyme
MSVFDASMIDHLNIGVSDADRSRDFYVKALEPLGYRLTLAIGPEHAEHGGEQAKANGTLYGFGLEHKPLFWILGNSRVGTGTHIGFKAATRAQVDAFYHAALAAGGTDTGKPGLRRYHPNYYGAFVLDPDGINIEAVCHSPE